MKKHFFALTICFCFIISGCAPQNSGTDIARATLENPLQVPLVGNSPSVYIQSNNTTQAREDIDGLLIALLQSEYNMHIADDAKSADYIINLTVERFGQVGTESTSASTGEVALPALGGAVAGAQIGSSIDGGDGALIGAGVGAAAGIAFGLLTSGSTAYIWEMLVEVEIEAEQGETFTSRIDAKAQGEEMDDTEAAQALENEVAWAIVRTFKRNN